MPQPATESATFALHAHVPHCTCDECLNSSTGPAGFVLRALCDECRRADEPIDVPPTSTLRLRCDECGELRTQGQGIEVLR